MEEQKLFQIGEVAKMFHISVGSLRHYEEKGLLIPEYIDENTGYRYYSIRQFEVLNTIRYLRVLDMPLNQIAQFLQNRDIDVIEDKLLKQKELVVQKKEQLVAIERKIDHRLEQLKEARSAKLEVIEKKKIPPCKIVWIKDSLSPKSYLDLEYAIRKLEKNQKESVVFLGKVGIGISKENLLNGEINQYNSVFLILDEEDDYKGEIEECKEEECVCICFCGGHGQAEKYYQKLMDYIKENKMKICGFSKEITMIDYGITSDPEKFVTQIRIPVEN